MSDVDGLLEKTKSRCHRNMEHGCKTIAVTTHEMLDIIATIEQQRAELSAKDRRIELMEAKLDAWHDLYGSEDWRSVLAAEMEEGQC